MAAPAPRKTAGCHSWLNALAAKAAVWWRGQVDTHRQASVGGTRPVNRGLFYFREVVSELCAMTLAYAISASVVFNALAFAALAAVVLAVPL
jgi:hypothetical protein